MGFKYCISKNLSKKSKKNSKNFNKSQKLNFDRKISFKSLEPVRKKIDPF